jgi:hypothetical protein
MGYELTTGFLAIGSCFLKPLSMTLIALSTLYDRGTGGFVVEARKSMEVAWCAKVEPVPTIERPLARLICIAD